MSRIKALIAALYLSGAANALSITRRAMLGSTSYDFVAGQHNKVGTIDVAVTAASVSVTFKITMLGTSFTVSHIGVGCDKSLMTITAPGSFKNYATDGSYKTAGAQASHASGTTIYTYMFPLSGTGNTLAGCTGANDKFTIYAHANVVDVLYANGGRGTETGWGCTGWTQSSIGWVCGCTKTGTDATLIGKWPAWCIENAPTPDPSTTSTSTSTPSTSGTSNPTIMDVPCSDTCTGLNMRCVADECTCNSGYQWAGGIALTTCEDINECEEGTSGCDLETSLCKNTIGSSQCVPCGSGYRPNADGSQCVDIDECAEHTSGCDLDTHLCKNTAGSSECIPCNTGYQPNDLGTECVDINECDDADLNDCETTHATCLNNEGSFTCPCNAGWMGEGTKTHVCVDIDECAKPENNTCETTHATCLNNEGSFTCPCNAGWMGEGTKTHVCVDIDECAKPENNTCETSHATCLNNEGSFTCPCNAGWMGEGTKTHVCVDIDECANPENNTCETTHATCLNNEGSFTCPCNAGWTGQGTKSAVCTDINECLSSVTTINACYGGQGNCNNNDGSYTCSCNSGFIGAGRFDDKCKASDFCSLFGQYNRGGVVTVSDSPYSTSDPKLNITIDTRASGLAIKESHVAIACTKAGIPSKDNTPIPGQFSKCNGLTCVGAQHSLPASTLVDSYTNLSVKGLKCPSGQPLVVVVHYVYAASGETTFGCGQCVPMAGSTTQATCAAANKFSDTSRWAYYIPFVVGKI